MKTYLQIGSGRLLNIQVFYDGNVVYEGRVEDAPDDIKALRYNKVDAKNGKVIYNVFSSEEIEKQILQKLETNGEQKGEL